MYGRRRLVKILGSVYVSNALDSKLITILYFLQLTGNPSDDSLFRCASFDFSEGLHTHGHILDFINNPYYCVRKPFRFLQNDMNPFNTRNLISGVVMHAIDNYQDKYTRGALKRPIDIKKKQNWNYNYYT